MDKKNINKRIEHLRTILSATIEAARIAIYDIVKANGGFIFIDDEGDTIYGYALNGDDFLEEYIVKGLRTTNDGDVEVYLVPILRGTKVVYTAEDVKNDTDADNWYTIGGSDGALYSWDTIISILESIEEYVD